MSKLEQIQKEIQEVLEQMRLTLDNTVYSDLLQQYHKLKKIEGEYMKNEKLGITFTNGYRPLATFIYKNENENSDMSSLLEEILKEQILPNNWLGLVLNHEELDEGDEYQYISLDLGYYIDSANIMIDMFDDKKINYYRENNVKVIDMD